jgi:hypothetical protein
MKVTIRTKSKMKYLKSNVLKIWSTHCPDRNSFFYSSISYWFVLIGRQTDKVNLWKMNELFGCFKLDPTYSTCQILTGAKVKDEESMSIVTSLTKFRSYNLFTIHIGSKMCNKRSKQLSSISFHVKCYYSQLLASPLRALNKIHIECQRHWANLCI